VVPVADSSDKPITAETELEDPTDNAVAVSESDGDAYSLKMKYLQDVHPEFHHQISLLKRFCMLHQNLSH
jgi:hypothetical protein